MMAPVVRLIVLRATPKADLVGALARVTVPALIGSTSVNTVAFADGPPESPSSAASLTAVLQQLSGSVGIMLAALGRARRR